MVTIQEYTLDEWRKYLEYYSRRAIIKCSFLHHTYIPDEDTWDGLNSMYAIRQAHLNRNGRDIFCHCYTTPDGTVFNGRPPTTNNCACQAPPEGFNFQEFPEDLQNLILEDYPHNNYGYGDYWRRSVRSWPNKYGFSIETVGNFDVNDPHDSKAMQTSISVLGMVHDIWDIPIDHIFFHRDVSPKTCPGMRVSKAWVKSMVSKEVNMPDVSPYAKDDVEKIKERGIMNGYPDGTFRGTEPVTREQLAIVTNRTIEYIEDMINR